MDTNFMDEIKNNAGVEAPDSALEEHDDPEVQKTIDRLNGKEELPTEELPSEQNKEVLFANKYKSIDELKKGITNIGSKLPEYVLEGMSEKALEQHYLELQKEFTNTRKEEKKYKHSIDDVKEVPKEEVVKIEEGIKNTDVYAKAKAEFEEKGGISNATYESLEKMNIPSEVIDGYLDSIKAKQVEFTNNIYSIAGGEQQFNAMKEWAENGGIPKEQVDAISSMTDYNMIAIALEGVKAKYDASNKQPVRILGGDTQSSSGYKSRDEYIRDVSDKRYGVSRAYTDAVEKKFGVSKF
jgi:hypothetical protein